LLPGLASAASPAPLWSATAPLPTAADAPVLQGVAFHVIRPFDSETDGYRWLHGVALAWHEDKLYASFGRNKGGENTGTEEAHGAVSSDGGQTWSPPFTIDVGDEPDLAVSHGVFLSEGGTLWSFNGAFHGKMQNVHTRAYTLDEATGTWTPAGAVVGDGFWPMQEPLRMDDGNWIMSGFIARSETGAQGHPAAVAISHGDDFTAWDLVVIPKSPDLSMWGESSVIVNGKQVLNIARYGNAALALVATSNDYGRTWSESTPSNLPMTASKPYSGTLSTGQPYLICTTVADVRGRSPLTIAIGEKGDETFSRVYVIRKSLHEADGESHPSAELSYPYAVEHGGALYVGYSNTGGRGGNHNSAELAVIPIDALAAP
jgi:hypothetical protein